MSSYVYPLTHTQIEDVEGLYTGLCCARSRPLIGGCPWCKTKGVYIHKKVTYPGAVCFTDKDDPMRALHKKEFKKVKGYKELHDSNPPAQMTLKEANESADKVNKAYKVYICVICTHLFVYIFVTIYLLC